jgi:hypothetical protein
MRSSIPFDVGRDYAMWATITLQPKMRTASQRIPKPLRTESPDHFQWNQWTTSTVIRIRDRRIRVAYLSGAIREQREALRGYRSRGEDFRQYPEFAAAFEIHERMH